MEAASGDGNFTLRAIAEMLDAEPADHGALQQQHAQPMAAVATMM